VYLNEAEATAMDAVIEAHELGTSVTAASNGIDQATLESLLAKGVLKSLDGVSFAVVQEDLR
jgi:hypothetical protein